MEITKEQFIQYRDELRAERDPLAERLAKLDKDLAALDQLIGPEPEPKEDEACKSL
jgi:hypothetical protein